MRALATLVALLAPLAFASAPPDAAQQYLPLLAKEAKRLRLPFPAKVAAAQIDHETACPRKKTCWRVDAEFKTKREQGVGLPMITRVYNADGSLRFDSLEEMRRAHPQELIGWTWKNPFRPEHQIAALILKNRDNWQALAPMFDFPLAPVITAYNKGVGGVRADIRRCTVTRGCNPRRWEANVETACKGGAVIPGTNRTACQISGAYYRDIQARVSKYESVKWAK